MKREQARAGWRVWIGLGIAAVALALLAPLPGWLRPASLTPIALQAEVLANDVYDLADRASRIPAEIALPHLARAGVRPFVQRLPLEEQMRTRVLERLDSDDFVDELVPFLLALKDMYAPADASAEIDFDAFVRERFEASDAIPGMEHSMFRWTPEEDDGEEGSGEEIGEGEKGEADASGLGIDREVIGQLLAFYDALYLAERPGAARLDERLSCDQERGSDDLAARGAGAQPALEALLARFRSRLEPGSEMEASIGEILADPGRLETIGLTVVQFFDHIVCKHYRIFASRVSRERQLEQFLLGELAKPGGGRLWRYLDGAQNERRYGALVVVDGLQGHLLESLASGQAGHPFLAEVLATHERAAKAKPMRVPSEPAPEQRTAFLEHAVQNGFRDSDYLRFFRRLYDSEPSSGGPGPWGVAVSGISTTPTISVRNLPVVKTGAGVAGEGATGIPNFHFVDRTAAYDGVQQGRAYYFYGNDALLLTSIAKASGMRSLFERLPHLASYSCASQYDEWAHAGIDPFFNLALGESLRDFGELLCFSELARRASNERELRKLRERLLAQRESLGREIHWFDWYGRLGQRGARRRAEQIAGRIAALESEAMPQLLVWYDPWPDHFAHFTGPFADEILSPSGELARLDYWLTRLTELYEESGVAPRTLFGMVGDHGLSPVFALVSPEALVLEALRKEGVPLRVVKISSDEGEGPKLTNPLKPPSMRGYDVVVASTAGGNLMLDLFLDQGARWADQPLEADLRRWQPIEWLGGPNSIDLIDELRRRLGDSLDYLAVRVEDSDAAGGAVRVLGPRGSGLIVRRGERIRYETDPVKQPGGPAEGAADVLDTTRMHRYTRWTEADRAEHQELWTRCMQAPDPEEPDTWCRETEWRRLTRFTPRPDSVVQLAHLYDLDRAGTINLFPADGVAYNSIVPGRHAGESFHEKDAFAGVWGAPVTRSSRDGRIEAALGGSIPTAVYEHLAGRPVEAHTDGWAHPSLWDDLYPDRAADPAPSR